MSQSRYIAAADGTAIYCDISTPSAASPATSPAAVLLLDGIGCDGFIWRPIRRLLLDRTVVHPHYRGHGRSARPGNPESATVAQLAADAVRALDATGVARAVVLGHSLGVQIALEMMRHHADRVAGLGLLCGAADHLLVGFFGRDDWGSRVEQLQGLVQKHAGLVQMASRLLVPTRLSFELARRLEIHPDLVNYDDFLPYLIGITHTDMELFFALLRSAMAHDARELLPSIAVPTTVVAGRRDRFVPAARSEAMAVAIAGSSFIAVDDGSHVTPIERADLVNDAVISLLARCDPFACG